MPLRPFPLPLSIGTDIASVRRVQRIVSQGDDVLRRYLRRFLTAQEQRAVLSKHVGADLSDPVRNWNLCQHLAGRWAAKEATMKAVTWRKLGFHDIIIRSPPYAKTGYVHAVILDPHESSQGSSESTPTDVGAPSASHANGLQNRSNSMETNSKTPPELASMPEWLHDRVSERDPRQEDETTPLAKLQENPRGQADLQGEDGSSNISGQIAQISISHDGAYATAVCLAAQEPTAGDVGGELAARNL